MRFTNLFSKTLREQQRDSDTKSCDFMIRAGYIRALSAGIYSYLHFGQRCMRKIEQILREEMDNIGGDEISMPVVHPAEIWKRTKRWYDIDESLVRFKDRSERDMVLAMTHEEIVAELTAKEIETYRQLPKFIYQIQTKFRDEPRARGGLIRVKEFTMKDAYSLDTDEEGLKKQYIENYNAYFRIFARTGLPVIAIESDSGMMGGKVAHEFMYLNQIGEDTIFICEESGYKANKEVAAIKKEAIQVEPAPLEKVHTPKKKTIEELCEFLNLPSTSFAKVVFFTGIIEEKKKVILAIVRGDMEANPIKIQNKIKAKELTPATDEEISSIKAVAGYASPIGIERENAFIIVDDLIVKSNNLVVGANEEDYHFKNACFKRDFSADMVEDIVYAFDGACCPISTTKEHKLKSVRGVEVGNIFQLGTKYTEALEAFYVDENGKRKPIIMGSYGIGVGRLLACLAEHYNDEKGLKLPISIVPYHVIITSLMDNAEVKEVGEKVYEQLRAAKVEVIYDNRPKKVASAGKRFNDADLIGIPIRITISKRSLKNGGVELKLRGEKENSIISVEEIVSTVKDQRDKMFQELEKNLENVEKW